MSIWRCTALFTVALAAVLVIGRSPTAAADNAPDAETAKNLADELPRIAPKEPQDALKTFEVLHGFSMQLIAHEPMVADPTCSVIDENGLMYVVEMRGYPYQKEKGTPPIGQVRVLKDQDGDGVYEKSSVFVDQLSWPTGVALWRGGVYVAVAPDIWYFKDTDGDRKADVKRKVFTGFGVRNVQALLNNLKWGLDHRIYGATAANAGDVVRADQSNAEPLSLRGQDFRFSPVDEVMQPTSGTAQFGNSFDDWGNRFVCSNSNHAQHVVLPREYLIRNPYLPVPNVIKTIAKEGGASPVFRSSPAEPWRIVRTRRRAASGEKYAATELVPIGFFTSAAGITIYRGDAYPEEFRGNVFVGDVGGNLVHRKVLHPDGASFLAVRADENTEFIRSTDNWFRPVNFTNAPDGTLHILDMYRETIEHPWSIPDDIKAHLDLESGRDRGRIYRLTPPNYKPVPPPRLGEASTDELVRALENPNSWWRETAHRLLFERQDPKAVPPLRQLLKTSESPQTRVHALYSLAGLDSLGDVELLAGLGDASPRVREHAVKLAERRLADSAPLREKVVTLADDADPKVRLQVAFSLGEAPAADDAVAGLAKISKRDGTDVWFRTAVLSSVASTSDKLLAQLMQDQTFAASADARPILGSLVQIVGVRNNPEEIARVLASLQAAPAPLQQSLYRGLGNGLRRSGQNLGAMAQDPKFAGREQLAQLFEQSLKTAADESKDAGERVAAIEFLGYGSFEQVGQTLAEVLDPRQPNDVQLAAVQALAQFRGAKVAEILLEPWKRYTPPVRAEVVEALVGRKDRLGVFLDAMEKGEVAVALINPNRKEALLKNPDAEIRQRAEKLFGADAPSPRSEVITQYLPALKLTPNTANGQHVFKRECATCHKLGNEGHQVGPDLATVQNRTTDGLMMHILDPNREVLPNYLEYLVLLDDGRTLTGIIASESATSITLRRADNAQDTVLRQNIEQITSTGKSLMPEGLEQKITQQEMADLLEFITQSK